MTSNEQKTSFVCETIQSFRKEDMKDILTQLLNIPIDFRIENLVQILSPNTSQEEIRHLKFTKSQTNKIRAALKIGFQLYNNPFLIGERFSNSKEVFEKYRPRFLFMQKEYFIALLLNGKNCIFKEIIVSIGTISTSFVHPREAFTDAISSHASGVIFIHNHPSGDPTPSKEDKECTNRLCSAAKILGIRVIDHIIIGHTNYFSFADTSLLDMQME